MISRVSDAQVFALVSREAGRLQSTMRALQEKIASGRRLLHPAEDPLGAAQVVRLGAELAALAEHAESARFGGAVLAAQEDALGDAALLLERAQELATQHASSLPGPAERAAARAEVRELLEALTVLGNGELAGRRLFAGLALDAAPPFADPDAPGWTAATAYTGSTHEVEIQVGSGTADRVRVSTRGDAVFGAALAALAALEASLAPGGDVGATLDDLALGREALGAERASVAARHAALGARSEQVAARVLAAEEARSRVRDADLAALVAELALTETALRAVLATGAQLTQPSLLQVLHV